MLLVTEANLMDRLDDGETSEKPAISARKHGHHSRDQPGERDSLWAAILVQGHQMSQKKCMDE